MNEHNKEKENPIDNIASEQLIEIHDPELDPQLLIAEIRQRIQARRIELGYEDRTFPTFGDAIPYPDPPTDFPYSADLYYHMQQANALYEQVETEAVLADSSAQRVPILGGLWRLIRRQAHSLILFYVNRGLSHQVTVDRHQISVLNQLVAENEELKRAVASLQDQVEKQILQDKEV